MARERAEPLHRKVELSRTHLSALALAASQGELLARQHHRRTITTLLGAGYIRPYPGDPIRSGRYQITTAGEMARARAARMPLRPPGDGDTKTQRASAA